MASMAGEKHRNGTTRNCLGKGLVWIKNRFIMKMMRQLPFKYNARSEIRRKVIDEFCLVDLKEWEEKYPQYPICGLEPEEI